MLSKILMLFMTQLFISKASATVIQIDPGSYQGSYSVIGQTANVTGSTNLDLPDGAYSINVAGNGSFGIHMTAGILSSDNVDAATVNANVLTFNTTTVNISVNNFLGVYKIAGANNYAAGDQSVDLVKGGMFYIINIGQNGAAGINVNSDGSISTSHPGLSYANGFLNFVTTNLNIFPQNYTGKYQVRGVSSPLSGNSSLYVLPMIDYVMGVAEYDAFTFHVTADGTIDTVGNAIATSFNANNLVFNNKLIDVNTNGYSGLWSLIGATSDLTGNQNAIVVVPGMQYIFNLKATGETSLFNVSSTSVTPSTIQFSSNNISLGIHQNVQAPVIAISSPVNNSTQTGSFQLTLSVQSSNFDHTVCSIDGNQILDLYSLNYNFTLNTYDYKDGSHTISCTTYDKSNLSATATTSFTVSNLTSRQAQVQYKVNNLVTAMVANGEIPAGSASTVRTAINNAFLTYLFGQGTGGSGGGKSCKWYEFCGIDLGGFDIAGAIGNLYINGDINLDGLFDILDLLIEIARLVVNPMDLQAWVKLTYDVVKILDIAKVIPHDKALSIENSLSSITKLINIADISSIEQTLKNVGTTINQIANGTFPLSDVVTGFLKDVAVDFFTSFTGPFMPMAVYDQAKSLLQGQLTLGNITNGNYKSIMNQIEQGMKDYMQGNLNSAQSKFNLAITKISGLNSFNSQLQDVVNGINSVKDLISAIPALF